MPIINNKRLQMLNARGWLCLVLSGINLFLAMFLALHGSWMCIVSFLVSFLMWVGIYDPRNLKQENNEQPDK